MVNVQAGEKWEAQEYVNKPRQRGLGSFYITARHTGGSRIVAEFLSKEDADLIIANHDGMGALREALIEYGNHKRNCECRLDPASIVCTCGFEALTQHPHNAQGGE